MELKFRYNHWIPKCLRVGAIVLYPYVLFSCPRLAVTPSLLRHEYEHVRQVRRLGWLRFYTHYVTFQVFNTIKYRSFWKAYLNNPFEVEARAAESAGNESLLHDERLELARHS